MYAWGWRLPYLWCHILIFLSAVLSQYFICGFAVTGASGQMSSVISSALSSWPTYPMFYKFPLSFPCVSDLNRVLLGHSILDLFHRHSYLSFWHLFLTVEKINDFQCRLWTQAFVLDLQTKLSRISPSSHRCMIHPFDVSLPFVLWIFSSDIQLYMLLYRPRRAQWLERPLGVWEAGVRSRTVSHQIRKNWEVCASQLGINELGIRLGGSESV